ncbi:MAG: hypothetical protein NC201_03225 [Prevotella sp.]|nr:hypothetical protein [Bacteroides sp.]MCM1366239.1 hypothetical protein [Prevotella sp.]MCM1436356.1 hypothetical protein [Prevotella sp.]
MARHVAGKEGAVLSIVAMAVMATTAFFTLPQIRGELTAGICAPSPNMWPLSPALSWFLNTVLILGIAIGAVFANKKLVFVPGQDYLFPVLFLITSAANPWLTVGLNSSTILCLGNLVCMYMLMNAYGRSNATQEMFIIATISGLGGMVQYAFLLFVPVHLICAGILRIVRPKELCAFFLGLIAPYWTLMGLGIVTPGDFAMPRMESLFATDVTGLDLLFVLLETGIALITGLLAAAHNSLTVFTTSVRLMQYNRIICIFGISAAIFACLDFSNYMAYIETILLTVSIQVANSAESIDWKYSPLALLSVAVLYISLFICILTA